MKVLCEWGLAGTAALAETADIFVIVDVLSFSTCVDIGSSKGASIYPYVFDTGMNARTYAQQNQADLAGGRKDETARFSLSPATLASLKKGDRLVLPSPNGSTISFRCADKPTYCSCLRNAGAVAAHINEHHRDHTVAVIPAGEKWPDGALRVSIEDWLGAGALISALSGERSIEAGLAAAAFDHHQAKLHTILEECRSGQELIRYGFPQDVELAGQCDASTAVPLLTNRTYINVATS